MRSAFVTGAAGFSGAVLVERLIESGNRVYAMVRPGSLHNSRLVELFDQYGDDSIRLVEAELSDLASVEKAVREQTPEETIDVFFHLAWTGDKSLYSQFDNVQYSLDAMRLAHNLGCKRFIATGSQAEYGMVPPFEVEVEDRILEPFSAYGAAKVAACYLSRQHATELGIDWIWGRIFSLIGKYEPPGRMLPALYNALKWGEVFSLSSCTQNWDYLDVYDAADALIALAERGVPGEVYNIASGDYRPLKEYTEELKGIVGSGNIIYGEDADPYVSLQPSVEKIRKDTGWSPKRSFIDSIKDYEAY